jgi:hypothetical protein
MDETTRRENEEAFFFDLMMEGHTAWSVNRIAQSWSCREGQLIGDQDGMRTGPAGMWYISGGDSVYEVNVFKRKLEIWCHDNFITSYSNKDEFVDNYISYLRDHTEEYWRRQLYEEQADPHYTYLFKCIGGSLAVNNDLLNLVTKHICNVCDITNKNDSCKDGFGDILEFSILLAYTDYMIKENK